MARRRGLLLGLCFLVAFPVGALAQGVIPQSLPPSGSSLWGVGISSLPGLNWIQSGNIRIWPTISVGYKNIGLNFNLNIPPTQILDQFLGFPEYGTLLDTYPLDAKIQSGGLAAGTFRLDAQLTERCGLFGTVSANIPRTVSVESSEGPAIGFIPPQARRWTGSRFQWSEFEVGGWYNINSAFGLVAGIRFDRVSVRFSEPEPLPAYNGIIIFLPPPPTIQSVTFPNYSGDLNTFFTIPYVGCEILGPYFKGSFLIGSAGASLRLPLDLSHSGRYVALTRGLGRQDLSEQAEYSFKNAGLFLEAGLESTFPVRFVNCTLWVKGSWLRIRGDGDVNLAGQSSLFLGVINVFTLPEPFSASSSGTSTLSQYTFDVGLSGVINF